MKLPIQFLEQFLGASKREEQALHRLGVARSEYLMHEIACLTDAKKARTLASAAIEAGLRALKIDFQNRDRHFNVDKDGEIKELVRGEYVEVKELT